MDDLIERLAAIPTFNILKHGDIKTINEAAAALRAAAEREKELREALEPFARASDLIAGLCAENPTNAPFLEVHDRHGRTEYVEGDDFVRARTVLAKHEKPAPG